MKPRRLLSAAWRSSPRVEVTRCKSRLRVRARFTTSRSISSAIPDPSVKATQSRVARDDRMRIESAAHAPIEAPTLP
jgi:hypothetical protein